MKQNKLVKDIDEQTWNKFVALCKIKGSKVGDELSELLEVHSEKEFVKLYGKKK